MEETGFLKEILKQVVNLLEGINCEFALAGGMAYSALVEPRATVDIDFLILLDEDKIKFLSERLLEIFDTVIPHKEPMRFQETYIWRIVGIKGDKEVLLDFILANTPFHKEALKRRFEINFESLSIPIVTLEDLFILKSLADRPQDKVDIEQIKRLYEDRLDWPYIKKHLKE